MVTGPVTLGGANTYTGATTINAGGLLNVMGSVGSASTPSGAINIASNADLDVGTPGSIDIAPAIITNSGTLINDGILTAGGLNNLGTGTVD